MNRITPKAVNNEQQLDRRIKEIERQVQSFPVRNVGGAAATPPQTLRILGGNVVPPHDIPGVVRVDTVLEESAFATLDPTGDPPTGLPWADGIGYGEIGDDRVLIVHDGRGPLQYAVTKDQQFRVFAKSFTSALGFDVYVPLYAVAQ